MTKFRFRFDEKLTRQVIEFESASLRLLFLPTTCTLLPSANHRLNAKLEVKARSHAAVSIDTNPHMRHSASTRHTLFSLFIPATPRSYHPTLTRPISSSPISRLQFKPRHTRSMASATPSESVEDFHALLSKSTRVLALLGAGLSASSGLPTFRGAGGLWRSHDAISLATPEAFAHDPALVWRFYSYRRRMALRVEPNPAHYALAELSKKLPGFMTLSQNVDGLSTRAGHERQLELLHGSLFEGMMTDGISDDIADRPPVKCSSYQCDYVAADFNDPICPALNNEDGIDPTSDDVRTKSEKADISDASVRIPNIDVRDLPHCPQCQRALLRPAVVWFGEGLSNKVLDNIEEYIDEGNIDLIMVIGTGAKVYPAAGYISEARNCGARVCVVNLDSADIPPGGWAEGDFFFKGDAAVIVPELLRPVVGDLST